MRQNTAMNDLIIFHQYIRQWLGFPGNQCEDERDFLCKSNS